MSRSKITLSLFSAVCVLFATTGSAFAQFGLFNNNSNNCCNPCARPVVQNVYRSVPVTEYQQVTETVRKPVVETKYVDQPVTEYRPVTRQRTVEIPEVTHHNVTENRVAYRDAGYWQTSYQCRRKVSPCAYDGRPNFLGWLNRSAYSARQSFTPKYVATRRYVPRKVAYNVPVTRQVATRSVRKVTQNYTEMVAYRTTRRVAVNTVRYVNQKVTSMRPITVMRRVPIGTTVAYVNPGAGFGTTTAYGVPTTTTALRPLPDTVNSRTADRRNEKGFRGTLRRESKNKKFDEFNKRETVPTKRSSFIIRKRDYNPRPAPQAYKSSIGNTPVKMASRSRSGWKPRRSTTRRSSGPSLVNLKLVDNR